MDNNKDETQKTKQTFNQEQTEEGVIQENSTSSLVHYYISENESEDEYDVVRSYN